MEVDSPITIFVTAATVDCGTFEGTGRFDLTATNTSCNLLRPVGELEINFDDCVPVGIVAGPHLRVPTFLTQ